MAHRLSLLTSLLVLSAACGSNEPAAKTAQSPRATPSAEVLTLDHGATSLPSAIEGKPAIVSLWASWCEACKDEFDSLNRLNTYANEHGGVVVAVAVGDKKEAVTPIIEERRLVYMQLVDPEFKLADALGQRNVPATLVIDREGRIVFSGGALDEAALAAFKRVLADRPVAKR